MTGNNIKACMTYMQELESLKQFVEDINPVYIPEIDEEYIYRLTYKWTSSRKHGWELCDIGNVQKYIGDILNRHDQLIREEIDARIKALEAKLKEMFYEQSTNEKKKSSEVRSLGDCG
jgi:hypothetical protein